MWSKTKKKTKYGKCSRNYFFLHYANFRFLWFLNFSKFQKNILKIFMFCSFLIDFVAIFAYIFTFSFDLFLVFHFFVKVAPAAVLASLYKTKKYKKQKYKTKKYKKQKIDWCYFEMLTYNQFFLFFFVFCFIYLFLFF